MSKGFYNVPFSENEPVLSYEPGSPEKEALISAYNEMYNVEVEVPMYIGKELVYTNDKRTLSPPHDHKHIVGKYNQGTKEHVVKAIDSALAAKEQWANLPWHQRVSIFVKNEVSLRPCTRAKGASAPNTGCPMTMELGAALAMSSS